MKQDSGDRELPLILGLMPIIPKHFWKDRKFDATSLDPFVGSGPYVIAEVKPGDAVIYRKNPRLLGQEPAVQSRVMEFRRDPHRLFS